MDKILFFAYIITYITNLTVDFSKKLSLKVKSLTRTICGLKSNIRITLKVRLSNNTCAMFWISSFVHVLGTQIPMWSIPSPKNFISNCHGDWCLPWMTRYSTSNGAVSVIRLDFIWRKYRLEIVIFMTLWTDSHIFREPNQKFWPNINPDSGDADASITESEKKNLLLTVAIMVMKYLVGVELNVHIFWSSSHWKNLLEFFTRQLDFSKMDGENGWLFYDIFFPQCNVMKILIDFVKSAMKIPSFSFQMF